MACTTLRVSLTQESMTTFTPGLHLAQLFKRLQAVNAGHQQVEQNQVGPQALLHPLQGFFAGGGGFDFVVVHFEQGPDVPKHSRFVIDQQDIGRCRSFIFSLCWRRWTAGLRGTRKENLRPQPGSLSTQILPPMAFTRRRAMARPKPMPSV